MSITTKRLFEEIQKNNYSYKDIEKLTGISHGSIHRYATINDLDIPIKKLNAMAKALNVPFTYLAGVTDDIKADANSNKFIQIPKVAAQPSAGWGSYENSDDVEEYYSFRSDWLRAKGNPKSMVLMEINGDSMEPIILKGDMVMIDRDKKDLVQNAIYAVRVEDLIYLKYIDRMPGEFILRSRNNLYEPMRLDTQYFTDNSVAILGRVIWWCHDELTSKV